MLRFHKGPIRKTAKLSAPTTRMIVGRTVLSYFFCSALGRLVHAGEGVKAPGIADVRQALGYHPDEKVPVVSDPHVGGGMTGEMRLTAAPGRQDVVYRPINSGSVRRKSDTLPGNIFT